MPLSSLPLSTFRPFVVLASLAIVLYLLWWMKPVLIPLTLAVLITFVLNPIVAFLQHRRVPRVPAATMVMMVAIAVIGAIGWAVASQVSSLVDSFPQYEHNLKRRIAEVQDGEAGFVTKLRSALKRIGRQIEETKPQPSTPEQAAEQAVEAAQPSPMPVTVMPSTGPAEIGKIWATYGPLVEGIAAVALSLVLVLFMLVRREDLRDRVISVVGPGRLTVTTKALDDAGERISSYLLMQLAVNGGFGVVFAVGLYFIGVPYALTWGLLAAVLRYIPYLGAWIALLLPLGLSLLVAESWTMPLLIVALFLVVELVSSMVLEPWLYGRQAGLSQTATLAMVAFWTWLWGPMGLVLATPLTVCLVLIGKYVPFLKFFDTLLGDQPALEPSISYYQRLLARDQDEASRIARTHLETSSLAETFDDFLIPALIHAKSDWNTGQLSEDDHRFIVESTREIAEELATVRTSAAARATRGASGSPAPEELARARVSIIACPARDETDEVGLLMLEQMLDGERCELTRTTAALLASEVLALVEERRPTLLVIAALPPGGLAQVRLLCTRVHARFPELKILVGRWGLGGVAAPGKEDFLAAGATAVATTLVETLDQIATYVPIVASRAPEPAPEAAVLPTAASPLAASA